MSVVVLGMEMPKKCEDCEIETCDENYYGDESNHRCSLLYKGYTHRCRNEGRLDDCPLRPLPEKHGRLIDADEATRGSLERTGKRLLAIDTAPTIVEAEGD